MGQTEKKIVKKKKREMDANGRRRICKNERKKKM